MALKLQVADFLRKMVDRGIQGLGVVEFSVSYWTVIYLTYELYWIILTSIILNYIELNDIELYYNFKCWLPYVPTFF